MDNVDITKDFQVSPNNSPESEFCIIWLKNNKIFAFEQKCFYFKLNLINIFLKL